MRCSVLEKSLDFIIRTPYKGVKNREKVLTGEYSFPAALQGLKARAIVSQVNWTSI